MKPEKSRLKNKEDRVNVKTKQNTTQKKETKREKKLQHSKFSHAGTMSIQSTHEGGGRVGGEGGGGDYVHCPCKTRHEITVPVGLALNNDN